MQRRSYLRAMTASVAGIGLAGCTNSISNSNSANAEDYPSQDIRAVVPFAEGGGYDSYTRLSQPYWEEYLDGTMVVENVEGGGSSVAGNQVYRADPDGHTMMIWDTYQPLLHQIGRDVNFDIREMSHIGSVTKDANCIIVSGDTDLSDWDEFIDRATELSFGTAGVGTGFHILPIMLGHMTGEFPHEELSFVHYDGTGELLGGLERGEFDIAVPGTTTSGSNVVQATNSEMFAVFSDDDQFSTYLDNAGTPAQYYLSDLDADNIEEYAEVSRLNRIFTGPPDVPEEILSKQRDAFSQIIEDEEFLSDTEEADRPVINPSGADSIADAIQQNYETYNQDTIKGILQDSFG